MGKISACAPHMILSNVMYDKSDYLLPRCSTGLLHIGSHVHPLAWNWTVFYWWCCSNKLKQKGETRGSRVKLSWLVRRNRLERWLEGLVFWIGEQWEAAAVALCTVCLSSACWSSGCPTILDWKLFNEDFSVSTLKILLDPGGLPQKTLSESWESRKWVTVS